MFIYPISQFLSSQDMSKFIFMLFPTSSPEKEVKSTPDLPNASLMRMAHWLGNSVTLHSLNVPG
ncbi:hypothetical protein [Chryseobacterium sp. G0162]|uniref:hypothetical protein n=1 Tax=Chryseobacterium sp. G0162 TaxID=2487063 RepID=UPI001E621A83|nr:hypothetical protein [Chryseobacterium sp. G0162]